MYGRASAGWWEVRGRAGFLSPCSLCHGLPGGDQLWLCWLCCSHDRAGKRYCPPSPSLPWLRVILQPLSIWLRQITGAPLSCRNAIECSSCSASLAPTTQTFSLARDCRCPQSSLLISSRKKDQDDKLSKGSPGRRRTAGAASMSLFRVTPRLHF